MVGKAFLFLEPSAIQASGLSWILKMMGHKPSGKPQIVSLLGPEPIELFGFRLNSTEISQLFLQSIVCDKPLYRNEKDTISLLVLNLLSPNSSTTVLLRNAGTVFSRHTVQLGANGEGILKLRDLPVGDYDMVFEGQDEAACEFIVAEYKLVPLVAAMKNSKASSKDDLDVTLNVESFGVPVNGQVRITLLDRANIVTTVVVDAVDGAVSTSVKLTGVGPHVLSIQLVSDPAKTATVPLRGTRETERVLTRFSNLGSEVGGSLLPIGNSEPVRGIYLSEGALKTTPISLDRVADERAHLTVKTDMPILKINVVDTTFPRRRADSLDVNTAGHPAQDPVYKNAEEQFKQGNYAHACKIFEERRSQFTAPHPYYAYWAACCYARAGQKEKAVNALRLSFSDGWADLEHMENDNDLASLRDYEPYKMLLSGGVREVTFTDVEAGRKIEIETYSPISLLLLGAYVDGKAWEGWATVVTPATVQANVTVPGACVPGEEVTIAFDTGNDTTSVYAVVKDARLISPDTAELKLAAAMKTFVEKTDQKHETKFVHWSLKKLYEDSRGGNYGMLTGSFGSNPFALQAMSMPPPPGAAGPEDRWGSADAGWGGSGATWGANQPGGGPGLLENDDTIGRSLRQTFGRSTPPVPQEGGAAGGSWSADSRPPVARQQQEPTPSGALGRAKGSISLEESIELLRAPMPEAPPAPLSTPSAGKKKSFDTFWDDPEVIYAGFVQMKHGKGELRVKLPDQFADYIVECFVISGMNWASQETNFRAAKNPFVQLNVPVFTKSDEPCQGVVHFASTEQVTVKVFCDGKPVALLDDHRQVASGSVSGPPSALTFVALPGQYEAVIEKSGGTVAARDRKQVNEPGKLKRIVRTMRLLQAGQEVDLANIPGGVGISFLPALDNSFDVLVEATADYSHCCCEQTAAKILSGCAMYMLASGGGGGGDKDKKHRAEAVILAGIRREKQMWLKGRGFKAYPDRGNTPDDYYGRKASQYLWNLGLLKDCDPDMSSDLKKAIEEGLEMAQDTSKGYAIAWPPKDIDSCESAYNAVRYSTNGTAASAVSYVQMITKDGTVPKCEDPWLGTLVSGRKEAAYAAATLLRSGGAATMKQALALANTVISQFNAQGRLYSTCDSVAAIALMTELNEAGITKGGGKVEINGRSVSMEEAVSATEKIKSAKVIDGVATIAVDAFVEEDWNKFSSKVPLAVSLEKDGQHTRQFTAGDSIELVVTLEDGYKMGDLLWVALPDSLSRVVGGGQVKLFSVDFAGNKELRIALAATGVTEGLDGKPQAQSLALCVRNMFIEERAGNPGLIAITSKR